MSASVLASAEGSVAKLALVFAFWRESRLARGRCRGRWGRENCDACAGHLDGRVACVVVEVGGDDDGGLTALTRTRRWRLSRLVRTLRWLNIVLWVVLRILSLSLSTPSSSLAARPWGLKCDCGGVDVDAGHWKVWYAGHGMVLEMGGMVKD